MTGIDYRSHGESDGKLMLTAEDSFIFSSERLPYYDSSSELASLEVRFLKSFKCCGFNLSSLHELMEHKATKAHKEKEPEAKPIIKPDPAKFMRRPLSDYSEDELRCLGRDLPEFELNTTAAPAATLIATEPGTLRRKLEEQQLLHDFQKDIRKVRRTAHKDTISVADVAAYIRGLGKQQSVLLLRNISPALLEFSSQAKDIHELQVAAQKNQPRHGAEMLQSIVYAEDGKLPDISTTEPERTEHMQVYAQNQQRQQRQAERLRRIAHVTAARKNQERAAAGGSPQRAASYAEELHAAEKRKQQRRAEWLEMRAGIDKGKSLLRPGHKYSLEVSQQLEQRIERLEQRAQVLLQQEQPAEQRSGSIPHTMEETQPRGQTLKPPQAAPVQARERATQPNQHSQQASRRQTSPSGNNYESTTAIDTMPFERLPRNNMAPRHRQSLPSRLAEIPGVSATLNTVNAASSKMWNRAQYLRQRLGSLPLSSYAAVPGASDGSGSASSSQAGHIQAWEAARQQTQRKQAEWLRNIDPELLKEGPWTAGHLHNAWPSRLNGVPDVEMTD